METSCYLNSVDGLIQYRRFPLFLHQLSELVSEVQSTPLTNQNISSNIGVTQPVFELHPV